MKVLSLFSGIGGLDLAAEWAGMQTVAFCEIDDYACKVLEKRWPGVPIYRDVRELTAERLRQDGIEVDVIVGGFPCQDLSCAGKQAGLEGERSGLWFEMLRIISELKPRWVVAENVRGAVNLALDVCRMGLEEEGYEVRAYVIPASATGATHKRERLFIVAYSNNARNNSQKYCSDQDRKKVYKRQKEQPQFEPFRFNNVENWLMYYSAICGTNDGVPNRVDRLKCLGNSCSPQQAYPIFKAIMELEMMK